MKSNALEKSSNKPSTQFLFSNFRSKRPCARSASSVKQKCDVYDIVMDEGWIYL